MSIGFRQSKDFRTGRVVVRDMFTSEDRPALNICAYNLYCGGATHVLQREISNLHSLVGDKGFEMKVLEVRFTQALEL